MGIKNPTSNLSLYTMDSPNAKSNPFMGVTLILWVTKNLDIYLTRTSPLTPPVQVL